MVFIYDSEGKVVAKIVKDWFQSLKVLNVWNANCENWQVHGSKGKQLFYG